MSPGLLVNVRFTEGGGLTSGPYCHLEGLGVTWTPLEAGEPLESEDEWGSPVAPGYSVSSCRLMTVRSPEPFRTCELWAKGLFSKSVSSFLRLAECSLSVVAGSGTCAVGVRHAGGEALSEPVGPVTEGWVHICLRLPGPCVELLVNGQLRVTLKVPLGPCLALALSPREWAVTGVRLWRGLRSEEEVTAHMHDPLAEGPETLITGLRIKPEAVSAAEVGAGLPALTRQGQSRRGRARGSEGEGGASGDSLDEPDGSSPVAPPMEHVQEHVLPPTEVDAEPHPELAGPGPDTCPSELERAQVSLRAIRSQAEALSLMPPGCRLFPLPSDPGLLSQAEQAARVVVTSRLAALLKVPQSCTHCQANLPPATDQPETCPGCGTSLSLCVEALRLVPTALCRVCALCGCRHGPRPAPRCVRGLPRDLPTPQSRPCSVCGAVALVDVGLGT
jgi:hypothetical protein